MSALKNCGGLARVLYNRFDNLELTMVGGQQREHEPIPLLHAAGVVVLNDRGDKVLLVQHKKPLLGTTGVIPGMYGLPSGIKKPLQSLEMNGVDELRKETGIEAKPEDLREFPGNSLMPALIKRTDGRTLEILLHAYLYLGAKDIVPLEETSTTKPRWVTQEELTRLEEEGKLLPNVKRIVDNAREFKERLQSPAPFSVDWFYTSACTRTCDFCYGPVPTRDPHHVRPQIVERIIESSAEDVTFCGGEPLVRARDLVSDARKLKESGMQTILNTNGELVLAKFVPLLQGKDAPIDIFGFSIEGPDAQTQKLMRGEDSRFEDTLAGYDWAKEQPYAKTKLATVFSSVNKYRIADMAVFVHERLQPDGWRVYQYSPRGPYNRGQKRHTIAREEFNNLVAMATELAAPVPVYPSNNDLNEGCFIIDSKGDVLRPNEIGYENLGSCLTTPLDEIWKRNINAEKVRTNKQWIGAISVRPHV